ncbi:MAG: DUF1015 domain-containing protein [Bacteroidota bacterium]
MPIIKPFRAVRYNPAKVDLNAVVAPPYDVITPEQQNELYQRHPYNIVRLILGREEDRYTSAANSYHNWLKEGVFLRDVKLGIYYLTQTFVMDGNTFERKGVILRCRLEEFEKRIVLPHEKTLSKPKEDRLKLLHLTKANFSQIFSFYSDPERTVDAIVEPFLRTDPLTQVSFEGVEHSVWNVTESAALKAVAACFQNKQAFIADGHHRYETALVYRDRHEERNPRHTGAEPYNYTMMYLANMDDSGLLVLPTHRLVYGLKHFDRESFLQQLGVDFDCEVFDDFQTLQRSLVEARQHAFGMIAGGDPNFYLLRLRGDKLASDIVGQSTAQHRAGLDVTLLHGAVLEKILHISPESQLEQTNLSYAHDADEVLGAVRTGKAQIGFLMNPTRIEQVRAVALAGHVLPQKSTHFYPKLLSGLLINRLDD